MLLLLGFCLPLFLCYPLAIAIWIHKEGFVWENAVLLAIHRTAQPQLDHFAASFTQLGIVWGVFPVATAIALGLLMHRQWQTLSFWIATIGGSSLLCVIVKIIWHRERPHLWNSLYPTPTDFSFPSGHATASMTLFCALILMLWPSRWGGFTFALGGVFVLMIAWTRLYLGVHYPSDILAGWMIAISWTVGCHRLVYSPQNEEIHFRFRECFVRERPL